MKRIVWLVIATAVAAGCASKHRPAPATAPATQPDQRTLLALDQILPPAIMPSPRPATQPSAPAPLDALLFYAQAREAMLQKQWFTAVTLLEKAVALDGDSYELYLALGRASGAPGGSANQAIAAYEKAIELRPGDLNVRAELGRLYLNAGDPARALEHLRIARLTREYAEEGDGAAVVDMLLGRALEQQGYKRAALDQYRTLQRRLEHPILSIRRNPEMMFLFSRPELLEVSIGQLEEALGNWEAALQCYRNVAASPKAGLEVHARLAGTLLALHRDAEARQAATDAVSRFRASPESLDLMAEVYRRQGAEAQMIDELSRLHQSRPDDRALLFALAEALHKHGRSDQAQQLLARSAADGKYDPDVVKRLFAMYEQRDQVTDAARLLIEAMAARPGTLRELSPLWTDLLKLSRRNRLQLAQLQHLQVPSSAEAARLFWVSRVADLWNRDLLARSALEQAVKADPPLAPAYRALLDDLWQRTDLDDAQKQDASQRLIDDAQRRGDAGLAAELRGLTLLNQKQAKEAAEAFGEAMRLGATSPDLQLTYVGALIADGKQAQAEDLLWKIVADWPGYEDAYEVLFRQYAQRGEVQRAVKVLATWLAADPQSVSARLLQASVYYQTKRPDAAEKVLLELFQRHADNAQVLAMLQQLYTQTNRTEEFIHRLEEERTAHPENREAIAQLVRIYASQNRLAEAARVVDSMRQAVGRDPDLLYYAAHLYEQIRQRQTAEEVLQQVLRMDPAHAPANNDLGYFWAEQGKRLPDAEMLIRRALQSEPDNQSYLDSLGWVLYKQGKHSEAQQLLLQALGTGARPDPVVLDHLGDVLSAQGDRQGAEGYWQRALERLNQVVAERDDLKELRLQLLQKLKQADD